MLQRNLPASKLKEFNLLKDNKKLSLMIIDMIKQTYHCVVSLGYQQDSFRIGKVGDRDLYGGQIYLIDIKTKEDGVYIQSEAAFAFKEDYNPEECRIGHYVVDNVGDQHFGVFEMIIRDGQKDLDKRFADLNKVFLYHNIPLKT